MSLFLGIGRHGNPDGNIHIGPGPGEPRPDRYWWLVPAVLLAVFLVVRRRQPVAEEEG